MFTSATEIVYYRGDSYSKEFTITDEDTGLAIDINGYTFTMTVNSKKNPTDELTQIFQLAGVIIDSSAGKVAFTPTSNDNDVSAATYYYDVQMVLGATVRTVVKDKYIITQDITKVV